MGERRNGLRRICGNGRDSEKGDSSDYHLLVRALNYVRRCRSSADRLRGQCAPHIWPVRCLPCIAGGTVVSKTAQPVVAVEVLARVLRRDYRWQAAQVRDLLRALAKEPV